MSTFTFRTFLSKNISELLKILFFTLTTTVVTFKKNQFSLWPTYNDPQELHVQNS